MDINNTVKLIHTESERLKHDVSTLRPDALERPTPCAGWTVADVIAHLVWFAETYGGMIERGLRGDLTPADGFSKPPTLLPIFSQTYDALSHMLDGIGSDEWDKPCYHTHGLRSVQSFLPTIIQELAIHEWDIRSSLEPSPSLSLASTPI